MSNQEVVITIKAMYIDEEDKNGNRLVTSKGDPYVKVTLDTHEYGRLTKNVFDNEVKPNFKPNQRIRIMKSERMFKGKLYYNWEYPKNPYNLNKVADQAAEVMQPQESPPPPTEQYPVPEKPTSRETEARGKTRCQVAVAFIARGYELTDQTKQMMSQWTDYIMYEQ